MLMQAYRHAFPVEGRANRLSQDGLLRLMGQIDPKYQHRYDHSTVALGIRRTRPSRQRIELCGRALNLSSIEIDGLLSLAGLGAEENPWPRQCILPPLT